MARSRVVVALAFVGFSVPSVRGARVSLDDESDLLVQADSGLLEDSIPSDFDFQLFTEEDVLALSEEEVEYVKGTSWAQGNWWKPANASLMEERSKADWVFFGPRRRFWNQVKSVASTAVHEVQHVVQNVGVTKAIVCVAVPGCAGLCYLESQIKDMNTQVEYLLTQRLPSLAQVSALERRRVEQDKLAKKWPYACTVGLDCSQADVAAQEDDESRLSAAAAEVKATETKIHDYQARINALQAELKRYKICTFIADLLNKVVKLIEDNLCLIVGTGLWAAAFAADRAIGAIAAAATGGVASFILAWQNQPFCIAASKGSTQEGAEALGLVAKVVNGVENMPTAELIKKANAAFKFSGGFLCKLKDSLGPLSSGPVGNALRSTLDFGDCSLISHVGQMVGFTVNAACGNIVQAIEVVIQPLIMCNLYLKPDHSACQTNGCYR